MYKSHPPPSTQAHATRPSVPHSDPAPQLVSLWLCTRVILHPWPRLMQPDPLSHIQILLWSGSKFRYSGRTLRQTQKAKLDRPDHNFTRYVVYLSTLYHALLDSWIILQGETFYKTVSLFLTFCVILYHTLIIRKVQPGNEASYSILQ